MYLSQVQPGGQAGPARHPRDWHRLGAQHQQDRHLLGGQERLRLEPHGEFEAVIGKVIQCDASGCVDIKAKIAF